VTYDHDDTAARIIQTVDLWYHYAGGPPALRGINLSIAATEWVAILGCNGSGKTTLVKHFNGLLRPWRGQVLLAQTSETSEVLETSEVSELRDIRRQAVGDLAQTIGYLPQHPDRLLFAGSVREEIAFGPRQRGLSGDKLCRRIDEALAVLDLADVADLPPAVLGYGLRRKVSLAAVLALHPRVLVLDEPTTGLDAGSTRAFLGVVEQMHARGATIVMITHDLDLVVQYATRVILMRDGEIAASGPTRQILSDSTLLAAAGLAPLPITELYDLCALRAGGRWPTPPLMPTEFAAGWWGDPLSKGQP